MLPPPSALCAMLSGFTRFYSFSLPRYTSSLALPYLRGPILDVRGAALFISHLPVSRFGPGRMHPSPHGRSGRGGLSWRAEALSPELRSNLGTRKTRVDARSCGKC